MITPKNIGKGANLQEYYVNYSQEKGECAGKWSGKGAAALGLEGEIKADDMQKILRGFSLKEEPLCRNAGENHRGGWDFTFSAPKSVSIAWSNASEDLRTKIEKIHERSVQSGMQYFQDHAAIVRTGAQGVNRESADLVYGLFQHSSNRAGEPQLHTHSIIFNVAKTQSDGEWRTLESRDLYKSYMAASAYYKANFAYELKQIGIDVVRTKDSFEITSIPKDVCKAQSSRSKEIEDELLKRGLDRNSANARSKEAANLSTRNKKDGVVRDFDRWQKENKECGFGPDEQKSSLSNIGVDLTKIIPLEEKEKIISESLEKLTMQDSTFTKHQMHRAFAEKSIGVQGIDEIKKQVDSAIEKNNYFEIGQIDYEKHYTTAEMYDLEERLIDCVASRIGEHMHDVSQETIDHVLSTRTTISPEQKKALETVTRDGNGVSFLRGVAGAGKSYTMECVREVFELENYNVIGLSPTNKAASELEKSSGIKSNSIDSFLHKINTTGVPVNERTVIICDEGGMADSRKTYLMNQFANEHSIKLIYTGDDRQIQPILGGQAFGTSVNKFGAAELNVIIRQSNEVEGKSILKVRNGMAEETIKFYKENGGFHFLESRLESEKKLIQDWETFQSEVNKKGEKVDSLIIATTNKSVDRLNISAREVLKSNGFLKDGHVFKTSKGKIEVSPGEKLIFTDNNKRNGIFRSEIVTVRSVNEKNITAIKSDKGSDGKERVLEFDPQKFNAFKHGYAMTAHKSQGSTVDRAFVLVDGHGMDREKFYVALSRGRENNQIYVDKDAVGSLHDYQTEKLEGLGKEEFKIKENALYLEEITKIVNKSNIKITTQDFEIKDEKTLNKISMIADKKIDSITNAFEQLQKDFASSLMAAEKSEIYLQNLKEKTIEKGQVKEKAQEKQMNRFSKEKSRHREKDLDLEMF